MSLVYIVGIIVSCFIVSSFASALWYTFRIRRIQKLAADYNLSFSSPLPLFFGLYWFFWPRQIDSVEGVLNGHKIQLSDDLFFGTGQGMRETKILIDDQRVKPEIVNMTMGSINMLTSEFELRKLLENVKAGSIPQLISVKRYWWSRFLWPAAIIIGLIVVYQLIVTINNLSK